MDISKLKKSQYIEEIVVFSLATLANTLSKFLEKHQTNNVFAEIHQVVPIDSKKFIVIYNTYN